MQGVRVFSAAACALSLMVFCASAQADVVVGSSASSSGTGTTRTIPNVTVAAGANRLLAVGVSTESTATVTGVTYGSQALTQRVEHGISAQTGAGARAEVWTLSAPPVGSATVTVTLSRSAGAVAGATTFTGVDPISPVINSAAGGGDQSANSANLVTNNTSPADGMLSVLSLSNVDNTSNVRTQGSVDLVVADQRWNATSGVHGSGATRGGNTGQNQAVNAGVVWRWTVNDSQQRSPHAAVLVALRSAGAAAAPTVTGPTSSDVTTTSATLGGDVTSDGGGALSERGVIYCPGACTPAIGGPGTTKVAAGSASTGAFTVSASGLASSTTFTARAYAINGAGTSYSSSGTFTTLTPNRAPIAGSGGSYSTVEGQGLTLNAVGSADPDDDPLTYSWDVNGDGTYGDATGFSPTLTGAQVAALGLGDGPVSANVRVQVSDGALTTTSDASSLTVSNVAPAAALSDDGPVVEGSSATVSFGAASDPSSADTAAGFRYAYDVDGDGTYDVGDGTYAGSGTSSSVSVPTSDDGTITVKGAIIDKDGGVTVHTTDVGVANSTPSATLGNDGPVVEGSDATVSFSGASDPSSADTAAGFRYAYDVDGDGTYDVGDGTYAGSGTSSSVSVPTTDDGTITVKGAIIDKDGGVTTHTTDVVVTNAAPSVTVTGPGATPRETPLAFTLTATDPSSADAAGTFSYVIDWCDGSTGTVSGPASTIATHAYTAAGDHTISVVATDKDGGAGAADTLVVTIPAVPAPPDPPATTPAPVATPEPAPAPVQGASSPAIVKVESLSVAPRCVRASAATTRSVKLRYKLSGAASVRVSIQRAKGSTGVRRCPPARGVKQGDGRYKAGTYTSVTTKQTTGSSGGTSLVIVRGGKGGAVGTVASLRPQALLAAGQKLKPGTYLLTVTTLDAAGKPQATARVKFWVLKG